MSDYICENTLIRILKHLPVRSILRFRTVCKCWKELLDSDEFMHVHLALQNPQFLVQFPDEPQFSSFELRSPPFLRSLTSPVHGQSFTLVGTLHGVVCLDDGRRQILLWNPSIRKLSSIPLPLHAESYYCRGFWIDPSTKEFKIILLKLCYDSRVIGMMYSSTNPAWTAIPPIRATSDQHWIAFAVFGYAVMVAGVAHWKVRYDLGFHKVSLIVCFDFTHESFEFIEMPHHGEIMQFQGILSVLDWNRTSCQIHMRQQGLWIHMFTFNITIPNTVDTMLLLGMTKEIFWILFKTQPELAFVRGRSVSESKLRWYDNRVGYIAFPSDKTYRTLAYDFVESLLFP